MESEAETFNDWVMAQARAGKSIDKIPERFITVERVECADPNELDEFVWTKARANAARAVKEFLDGV